MGNQVRKRLFAGAGEVNVVTGPERITLFAQVGLSSRKAS